MEIPMEYAELFKVVLFTEQGEQPVNMSPEQGSQAPQMDSTSPDADDQTWGKNNPDIVDNNELNSQFDVEGLGKDEIEKYSEIITTWGQGIETAIEQLAQIIKFSAGERLSNAPGSEQFNALIKVSPNLKRDLSAFKSQVEDLEQTVKLAISDERKERKDKIKDLSH